MNESRQTDPSAPELSGWPRFRDALIYYVKGTYNRVGADHVFLEAGGLAFSIIICLLPLVLVLFSVVGMLLETPRITARLNTFIDIAIPYSEYADVVRGFVFARVKDFTLYKNISGIIGLVGLFFASSSLFSSIRTILHRVFHIAPHASMLAAKLLDVGLVILVLVYFLLAATVIPLAEVFVTFASELDVLPKADMKFMGTLFVRMVSFIIVFLALWLMYVLVPRTKIPWKIIVVSIASTALFWQMAQALFGVYIKNAIVLRQVYGAYILGTAAVLWIYASSFVFIVGAEIGQLYRERSEGTPP